MSVPPTEAGGCDESLASSGAALTKKRTKIVFLNPTELSNWDDWKSNNEQKHIGETDLLQYEEMLKNEPHKSATVDAKTVRGASESSSKKRRKPKSNKNGCKKRIIDPSQPWLEDTDTDEEDVGLEDELDDDEYFRRLEEEKMREEEEEARRKKEMSEARALARARGSLGTKKGGVPPITRTASHTGRSASAEASDSESFSEFGDGTASSFGGSRADADEFDNPRTLYPHDEVEETMIDDELIDGKHHQSMLDDLPPSPSSCDRSLDASVARTDQAKLATETALNNLAPTDSHTLRMLAMDPIRLRYCSPPLHLPGSSNDLVCPSEFLMDAFAIHEVLIRYGYLLRLSPFKIEDFLAALVTNENSTLLAEVHMVLLRSLLREDEATGTWMYSIDSKDSVNLSYHLLDRYTWPYLLAAYLNSVKATEAAARSSASSLSVLSTTATGPGGVAAAMDSILTAALFPEDLIPLDINYPFVPVRKRVGVLRGLISLFLSSRPVRGDQLRDGFLTHEDHCRVCQQSGEVLCCDGCTAVFHLNCLTPPLTTVPPANWICPVCLKKQVPGVYECLTEEERARKVHRKEALGSDRAGRTYWYIARRILVEPTDFTQREPCLPGILDGVYDPHWQQSYADRFLDEPESREDEEDSASILSANDDSEEVPERPLRRIRCNPCAEYANEPSVYYYSTLEQVTELRSRLSMRWEPWLCQRLDALMPRMQVEMLVTQQLTMDGLDSFCRMRPDHEAIDVLRALDLSSISPARSHVTRVFALLNAEAKLSQLRMNAESSDIGIKLQAIETLLKASPTPDLGVMECRAPDHLPDDLLNEIPAGEDSAMLGVLITVDVDTCVVRNHDGLLMRVAKSQPPFKEQRDLCNATSKSEDAADCGLTHLKPEAEANYTGPISPPTTFCAYRLSDEGSWRVWCNLYTVGVWLGPEQQAPEASRYGRSSNRSDNPTATSVNKSDDSARRAHHATNEDEDEDAGKSTTAPTNVLFSRSQMAEDRERKRVLGNKFNFTDTAMELWNYVEPPLLASFYTDLIELLKYPCALDDNLFRPDWPATPWRSMEVARLTIAYLEAQIPLAFFTPAWCSLRKCWLAQLMRATTLAELAEAVAILETSIRPLCFQRIWFSSVGHLTFERSTAVQREDDRRVRQLDRSASSNISGSANVSQNLIRTKTPKPIRHTVWKSRGEEYRRLGGDGWIWLSATRRRTSEEVKMLATEYPTISNLARMSDLNRPRNRGLQHGIGWGVCPEYLKGEVPVKPPKASECRGHVLHPITGIPLYLNTHRTMYIIPEAVLRQTQQEITKQQLSDSSIDQSSPNGKEMNQEINEVNKIPSSVAGNTKVDETSIKLEEQPIVCSSTSDANCSSSEAARSPENAPANRISPEPEVTEPPVVNISYGLSERVHFPGSLARSSVRKFSSRRLQFRLDSLLARRILAAAADKAAAEASQASIQTLETEIQELEQQKEKLKARLSELAEQAQEARTAKAKAVKARQAVGPSPMLQPPVRSAPFIVSTAGNRSINLAATKQHTPSVSRRLIQHSFINTSSGNRYRILSQDVCQPTPDPSAIGRRSNSSRRKSTRSRQHSSDEDSESDDGRNDEDEDLGHIAADELLANRGQQLRRSARKQRATRRDPDFVVDFDDEDDGEEETAGYADNRGRGRNQFPDNNDDETEGNDDYNDSDLRLTPRPRTRFPPANKARIIRLPQFDGTGDLSSANEESVEENNPTISDSSLVTDLQSVVVSNGPTPPKNQCLDNTETSDTRPNQTTSRSSGMVNRIVRLVRSVDQQNTTGSTVVEINPETTSDVNSTVITVPSNNVSTDGAKVTMDGLRFIVSTSGASTLQTNQEPAASIPDVATVASSTSSTTGSVIVSLPAGFRLISVNSATASSAINPSAPSVLPGPPIRLIGNNLIRTVPSQPATGTPTVANVPTTAVPAVSVTVTGPSAVRLVLQPNVITSANADGTQNVTLAPIPTQVDAISLTTSTESSTSAATPTESGAVTTNPTTRCQPAILRRTLAGSPGKEFKPSEFRVITIPQSQSIASLVATNTARQMAAGVVTGRDSSNDVSESTGRHTSNKAASRGTPLIEDRALPTTQRPVLSRLLPRGITLPSGMMNVPVGLVAQSHDSKLALERTVMEAAARLTKIDTEMAEIKQKLADVEQKRKETISRLSKLRVVREFADRPPSAPYSLYKKHSSDPDHDLLFVEKSTSSSMGTKTDSTIETAHVLLPAELPPVNTYVWPPLEWPAEKKRSYSSVSSLFRWHPKNLRGLILSAGRRELPGFDAEKKRLVQVIWPYPTAKPSLIEAWRFRLSQLRLKPDNCSKDDPNVAGNTAGQGLAHLILLLRSLWHMIRWDELLSEPPDGDHVLDDEGHPCFREVTDYADSGTGKSGEPSYCTRRIIGIQPLDRFWLRANYLVQLTHTRPGRDRCGRSRKARASVTRSGRRSTPGRHPWAGNESHKRRSGRRSGKTRAHRSGNDPDYNPSEDEPWRFSSRRSRRRRARGSDDDDDNYSNGVDPVEDDELDDSSDESENTADPTEDHVSHVEEVWMSEESLRMWEIRNFMNIYLPPSSNYLDGLPNAVDGSTLSIDATLEARRKPSRLPQAPTKSSQMGTSEDQSNSRTTKLEIGANNEHAQDLSTAFPLSTYLETQPLNRHSGFEPINLAQLSMHRPILPSTRRSRPVPELPPLSNEVLEAKARARSLAAARAARASVAARKAKAERMAVEQRARTLRLQLIARRRLYLNLARVLADEAVEQHKQSLFANDDSDSVEEDDSEPIQTSPFQSAPPVRRPRGRPPTSGRYRGSRGLRRPLTASQMSFPPTPTESPGSFSAVSKTPLRSVADALDNEEQENKPEWPLNRGDTVDRPKSIRRGSTPGRRGRPRSRGLSRPSLLTPRMPEVFLPKTPVLSPAHDNASEASSAPSTPSTCPGLGDTQLENLLTMPDDQKDPLWSPAICIKPEQSTLSSPSMDSGRNSRGTRRRIGRPPGRNARGTTRRSVASTMEASHFSVVPPKNTFKLSPVKSPQTVSIGQKSEPNAIKQSDGSSEIYCLCRTPYDPGREYLGCDLCQDWFHFECVGLTPSDASKLGDSWHCPGCQKAEKDAIEMLYCLCRTPYEPTRVYIACDRCDEWYHAECVGLTSQQAATHAGTYLCPRCTEVKTADVPAQHKDSKDQSTEDEPSTTTKTLYETLLSSGLQSQLFVLLQELQEHKMAWPFLQLPDPKKYPALDSLEDPKTLARIAERLTGGKYATLGDFSFAMNSLFFDARILFLKGTPEFQCTEVMEALFIRKMKELKTRSTPPS